MLHDNRITFLISFVRLKFVGLASLYEIAFIVTTRVTIAPTAKVSATGVAVIEGADSP